MDPFIKINCAALNENLLESELFGHEKGAFTGAIQTRKGRLEEANDGTIFLDEIGDFSFATQVKLLRVLQEREFERVGSNKTIKTNARIITATNRDLELAVEKGTFRQDLYYRINVFPILLPPLRDRKDDILLLADFFAEQYSKRMNKEIRRISTQAINMMACYHWPGNVRELENCIERAVLLSQDGVIHGHHLPPTLQTSDASGTIFGTGSLKERVSLLERDLIIDALKRCNGNLAASAQRSADDTARILRYKVKELEHRFPKRYSDREGTIVMAWASSGLHGLDKALCNIKKGDNVVWQVDCIEDYNHFVAALCQSKLWKTSANLIYMRFAQHGPLVEQSAWRYDL